MNRYFSLVGMLILAIGSTSCVSRRELSRNNMVATPAPQAVKPSASAKQPAAGPNQATASAKQPAAAQKLPGKFVDRETARATPSLKNLEGPIAIEKEKLAERAYPGTALPLEGAAIGRRETARIGSFNDFDSDQTRNWALIGPETAIYPAATSRTNGPFVVSGRITALAIDPRCDVGHAEGPFDRDDRQCRLLVGAAGGGIWRTDKPFSNTPQWQFTSGDFATNAIGTIAMDPIDPNIVYAGTGEPNASADSAAGLGLYRSYDGGEHWLHISSTLTYRGASGPVTIAEGFNNLSISSIAFDPRHEGFFYVATTLGVRGVSATNGAVLAADLAPPGLYKTQDGGLTFTQVWNGGGSSCAPAAKACATSWGVDKVVLDPGDPTIIYAAATGVGLWRSWQADNGGAFTQIYYSQNQGNAGVDRTDFALTKLPSGKVRIYVATGATGAVNGQPAPSTANSQVWRIDDAMHPAATLIASEIAASGTFWKKLTSDTLADPGYATSNFCTGQCWYDIGVYTPQGKPDTVYVVGSYSYGEVYFGISNGRGVLRSTTAGDPDVNNNNVTFTDLTFDAQTPDPTSPDWLTQTTAIHPDQHALVFAPSNPDIWFEGSDGGLIRSSGEYSSISNTCALRGLSGAGLTTCQRLLSVVPTQLFSLNSGLSTLQFQHLSINPNKPLGELQGGTQDNGTFQFEGSPNIWYESVGGDGGVSGFDASNPTNRFHTYTGSATDINLAGGDPTQWWYIADPLAASNESVRFYMPIIADPRPDKGGTNFAGLQWVWRTTDNGGDPTFLANNCNEIGPFTGTGQCGDWTHVGNRPLTGGTISWLTRATADTGTLWAGTASGRVYIFKGADAADPSTASENEVSNTLVAVPTTPVRFVSGIAIDPANPNHGWVSYGGYDSVNSTVPGHVFDVKWDGVSAHATFTSLDGSGDGALGDLPVNSLVRDDLTGDLFVATDFGVLRRDSRTGHWHTAAGALPMVEVSSLAIDSTKRVLYAATHGRSAWQLKLCDANRH